MHICKFCSKECKNNNSLRNHERLCKFNPDRPILVHTEAWYNAMYARKGRGTNQYTKAKKTGIPYQISDETRKKISESNKNQIWSKERRLKHSDAMKRAVINNPDSYSSSNVCGRVKIIEYNGIKLHGKWEAVVAEWFDRNNVIWSRDIKPFNYFWNGGWHLYFPDFYIPSLDLFIEVKGYETDRDVAKWSCINNLVVLKYKQIREIRENKFELIYKK